MKEKVLHINLPNGADYRRVEVTEDGKIGIVYTEQNVSNEESIKTPLTVSIPKPASLIGGTEVYKKDNGTGYWYCKIKEGRDEFMHLYFEDLTEEDLFYDTKGKKRKFFTDGQKKFRANVLEALDNKPEEGFRWIPVYEPSNDESGNIQYVSGANVLRGLSSYNWEENFKNYSPENGSRLASNTTYFLLLLRWLKDGVATIEQLADDSKDIGHYWDSKNAKHDLEKTGEREFGGLCGFVGNTYKEVKDSESKPGFLSLGGSCNIKGYAWTVASVFHIFDPYHCDVVNSVGLLELTK